MKCSNCGIEKDQTEFYKKAKQCIECTKEKRKARNENKKLEEMKDKIHVLDFSGNENEEVKNTEIFDGISNNMIEQMLEDGINSVFKLLSKRLGKHWELENGEANSISKPTINILSKSTFYSKLMENADIVALSGALSFVLLPRIFVTINDNKQKNVKEENINAGRKDNTGKQKNENKTNDRENDKPNEFTENLLDDFIPVNF